MHKEFRTRATKYTRQITLRISVFVTGMVLVNFVGIASAQEKFPTKPLRILVGYVAGGQPDTLARMIGLHLGEKWRIPVVIDNRAGGAGTIAAVQAARVNGDGYTLLLAGANFSISAATTANLPYAPLKDFTAVSRLGVGTTALAVAPNSGIKSVNELVALAKAQPGKIIFASPPAGSGPHLAGAGFSLSAGIKVVTVAYKGTPEAMIEVMSGRAHYTLGTVAAAMPFIKEKKLQVLAVQSPKRFPLLPDVPTFFEAFHEYKFGTEAYTWLLAPAGTPGPILNLLHNEIVRILAQPEIEQRLLGLGFATAPSAPKDYQRMMSEQIASLSRLVAAAGLKGP